MNSSPVSLNVIESKIFLIRGRKVMIDSDLAELYAVETKNLNKAVHRNIERFPGDFMFQLDMEETELLRFQIGTSKAKGGRRYLPYVFTQEGISILSGVLNSDRAVLVNIAIMRTFVKLREMIANHEELARKLSDLEEKYDSQFESVFAAIRELMSIQTVPQKMIIGLGKKDV